MKCEHGKSFGCCKYPGCSTHDYDGETGEWLGYKKEERV